MSHKIGDFWFVSHKEIRVVVRELNTGAFSCQKLNFSSGVSITIDNFPLGKLSNMPDCVTFMFNIFDEESRNSDFPNKDIFNRMLESLRISSILFTKNTESKVYDILFEKPFGYLIVNDYISKEIVNRDLFSIYTP